MGYRFERKIRVNLLILGSTCIINKDMLNLNFTFLIMIRKKIKLSAKL